MKIFDCFMYFDEDMLLEIRLNELEKFVDKFVIVESNHTHSGIRRKLLFDINKFSKFKDKIIYVIVDSQPKVILKILEKDTQDIKNTKFIMNAVKRENFQRNEIFRGLHDAKPNDLILLSDLDEIPDLNTINIKQLPYKIILFKQKNFYYKFNLCLENYDWFGTKACKYKDLISPQWLRNVKNKKYPFWRLDIFFTIKKYQDIHIVNDGGWHFSYFKDAKGIEEKLKSYLHHHEYDLDPLGVTKIKKMIESNIPVYDLKTDMKKSKFANKKQLKVQKDLELPKYIINNKKKYNQWFV